MRKESDLNRDFLARYRARRPFAEAWKVNDRVGHSRPDLEIHDYGQTWFVEGKREDGALTDGQTRMLDRLGRTSRGRVLVAWYGADRSVRLVREGQTPVVCRSMAEAVTTVEGWIAARALDGAA